MQERLNILVFAYVFPPDAGSGTYRTLYFTNHWARLGDSVTVVTVREDCFLESALVDHGLCREIHPSIRVLRASAKRPLQRLLAMRDALRRETGPGGDGTSGTGAAAEEGGPGRAPGVLRRLKDTLTDLLSCPDEHIGWVPDAVRQAARAAESTRFDCIYASGGPWSAFLAARRLHRRRGIPLVLDFRDPWISNPNLGLKTPLSRRLQEKMESMCVRAANLVVANTEELRRDFIKRYPGIAPERFITVTNGFEDMPRAAAGAAERFTLVHAGALYQSRNPLNFLRAVVGIVRDGAIPAEAFRVRLVGGVAVADPAVEAELRSPMLRDVLEIMPRVPHDEALALQRRASALLLFQTGFPLQVPRKIYEYLSLARPILAIAESDGATARMVNELQAGHVVDDDINAIRQAILGLYQDWKTGATPGPDEEKLRRYSNRYLARRLRDAMRGLPGTG